MKALKLYTPPLLTLQVDRIKSASRRQKIFLLRLLNLLFLLSVMALHGQKIITGKVTNEEGEDLSGVYISTKEGDSEAFTEKDGTYHIEVKSEEKTLLFEYMGYKKEEVPVKADKIDVILKSTTEKISKVVITGFQKIDQKLFTGAATRLKGSDVQIAGVPDITRALQGQVAGVEVQNVSGTFGAAPIITIRGASSINGNNKPLFVIDGVVQEDLIDITADDLVSGNLVSVLTSGIAGLNQNDIQDIQILKDVSATAIYGAQALNGVIVITTKEGRSGKPRVNYSVNTTIRQRPDASDYNLLDAGSELDIYREFYNKGYLSISALADAREFGQIGKMYELIRKGVIGWGTNPNHGSGWNEDYLKYYAYQNTDWFEVLFRNNITTQHSLSLSGGDKNSRYYASVGYYGDSGATESNSVDNYTALFKGDFNLNNKVKIGGKLQGNFRQQRLPGTRSRKINILSGQFNREFDINPFSYALNTSRLISPYNADGSLNYIRRNFAPFNELYELKHNYVDLDVIDITTQLNLEYKIKENVKFSSLLQGRYANTESEHIQHETSNAAEAYRARSTSEITKFSPFLYEDLEDPFSTKQTILSEGGFYNTEGNRLINYYLRSILEWSPKLGEHKFNILAGNEIKTKDRRNRVMDGYGISYGLGLLVKTDSKLIDYLRQKQEQYFWLEKTYDRYTGNFFRAAYSYKKKYLLNGSFRYDGSNQLGSEPNARWLPSYNVSAGWNASEENFLKDSKIINYLKLKTTYGLTGTLPPDASAQLNLFSKLKYHIEQEETEPGIRIDDLENQDLTWEKLYEWNIGFELGLWNNRIFTEVNYYKRKSKDLIDYIETSGIGGVGIKIGNIGDLKAQGVEVTLKTENIDVNDFKWNTQFTFNYYSDKITRLESHYRIADVIGAAGGAMLGGPQSGIYSIPFAGLNSQGIPTFFDKEGNIVTNINLQNQDDIRSWLRYEGPTAPRYQGGLINRFKYKNWGLSVNIIYKAGNKIRLDNLYSIKANTIHPYFTDVQAYPREFLNRWMVPGDELTSVPAFPSEDLWHFNYNKGDDAYALYNNSTQRVAKGDFIRLKDIKLSYQLPTSWLKNVSIQSASLSFSINNVWLLYSDKKLNGMDPEFFSAGGVALPVQRTYNFSLNVNF